MGHMIEPSEFDLVVIGTGLIESIVAAAASKAGYSVLQVDPASHYGGSWASLRLDELPAALNNSNSQPLLGDELAYSLRNGHIVIQPASPQLLENSHSYSLDISPHLLYGAGPMISLLLGSGAHHYTEYKLLKGTVLRTMSSSNSIFTTQPVPSTRAEIFRDKTLSPLQKRTLMRFIKGLAEAMECKGPFAEVFKVDGNGQNKQVLFKEFMEKEKLDLHLQRCLAHGVLLQHTGLDSNTHSSILDTLTCSKALDLFKLYIESVGRYGIDAGPFLTPLYGCGELPQAFCRAAAVSGAVQVLRCRVSNLLFDNIVKEDQDEGGKVEEKDTLSPAYGCRKTFNVGVEIELEENSKQVIKAGKVAAGPAMLQKAWIEKFNIPTEIVVTHRCIAILDAPVEVDKSQALIVFPEAGPDGSTVWALQLSHSTAVCPLGQVVLHLWCCGGGGGGDSGGEGNNLRDNEETAEKYLMPCLESLADCSETHQQEEPPKSNENQKSNADVDDDSELLQQQKRPRALFAACFSLKTLKPAAGVPASSSTSAGEVEQQQQHAIDDSTRSGGSTIVLCPGPSADVTFATAVDQAKKCYWQLFPPSSASSFSAAGQDDSAGEMPSIPSKLIFPLDEAAIVKAQHADGANGNEEHEQQQHGGEGGRGGDGGGDVDSDDEALQALQAALELLPST